MDNNSKQWAVHALMTELTAQGHDGKNQRCNGSNGGDHSAIKRERLSALLMAETTFVIYHPTFISQIKAVIRLLKTAFLHKKRDGFVIIGGSSFGEKDMPRDNPATGGLTIDEHLEDFIKPESVERV